MNKPTIRRGLQAKKSAVHKVKTRYIRTDKLNGVEYESWIDQQIEESKRVSSSDEPNS